MSITEIVLVVMGSAVVLLTLMLIPAIASVRRAASSLAELADLAKSELPPLAKDIRNVLDEFKIFGGAVAEHSGDVRKFMSAMGETGGNLHAANRAVGAVLVALNTTSAFMTGIKVAGTYLIERYLKRKGGQ